MLASVSMAGTPVELRVGGQTYRVIASAEEAELRRLADLVDARLQRLTAPGRPVAPQALLLAAISLAHDLEEERQRRQQLETRSREMLRSILERIDAALETADQSGESQSPPPAAELRPLEDFDL
jgi:cell division protein ZapA